MNVSLTPELEQLVRRSVETGRYNSTSEVIREALSLLEERDQDDERHEAKLREKIAAGVASLRAGRTVDGDRCSIVSRPSSTRRSGGRTRKRVYNGR